MGILSPKEMFYNPQPKTEDIMMFGEIQFWIVKAEIILYATWQITFYSDLSIRAI